MSLCRGYFLLSFRYIQLLFVIIGWLSPSTGYNMHAKAPRQRRLCGWGGSGVPTIYSKHSTTLASATFGGSHINCRPTPLVSWNTRACFTHSSMVPIA